MAGKLECFRDNVMQAVIRWEIRLLGRKLLVRRRGEASREDEPLTLGGDGIGSLRVTRWFIVNRLIDTMSKEEHSLYVQRAQGTRRYKGQETVPRAGIWRPGQLSAPDAVSGPSSADAHYFDIHASCPTK